VRKLLAGVLIVVLVAVGIDFAAAAYAERHYSQALRAASELEFDPEVTITGFPFITAAAGDEYDRIGITARGTDLGNNRRGDLRSNLSGVERPGGAWLIDEDISLRVDKVSASLKIDSVNLGRFLGIEDLTVTTPAPEDKAGGGGPGDGILSASTGIVLTGTVIVPTVSNLGHSEGSDRRKVSVSADLSIRGGALRVDATGIYSGSADHVDSDVSPLQLPAVLAQFSQTLPVLALPWSLPASSAATEGSDVVLRADQKPLVVTASDFWQGP
jgi:LmeA-like phospholipid-binding